MDLSRLRVPTKPEAPTIRLTIPLHLAFAASTAALNVDRVLRRELVPRYAMRGSRQARRGRFATEYILPVRYQLQVKWVAARAVAAQMVQFQMVRDVAVNARVENPVNQHDPAVKIRLPVARFRACPIPGPAPVGIKGDVREDF